MTKTLHTFLLLDRSGSMEQGRDRTIGAVNEYLNGLRVTAETTPTRISLALFDSQPMPFSHGSPGGFGGFTGTGAKAPIDMLWLWQNVPAVQTGRLSRETYIPRGGTPLYDAIGALFDSIGSSVAAGLIHKDDLVSIVIVTDGEENSSIKHTKDSTKSLISMAQANGWLVTYLGADHDAFAASGKIGIGQGHTMSYNKMGDGNLEAMNAVMRGTQSYAATGQSVKAEFTADERTRGMK